MSIMRTCTFIMTSGLESQVAMCWKILIFVIYKVFRFYFDKQVFIDKSIICKMLGLETLKV